MAPQPDYRSERSILLDIEARLAEILERLNESEPDDDREVSNVVCQ